MTRRAREAALVVLSLALAAGTPASAQDLPQKLAAAKENAAQNQQALRSYGWIEKVELSLPDGTRYPGSVVLGMPASQIEVRITNSSYQKLAP